MKKKIIIAPLNWGLGHASRSVPIIKFLIENNFTPIIASDGKALHFLQKEFPTLETLELPSYNIFYGKKIKLRLLFNTPKILKAVKKERKFIEGFIDENKDVFGIISDNRFGVRSSRVPSVYITHQVNVLSGITTFLTSKIHQKIIKKFDECWIPDTKESSFSGKLSLSKSLKINLKYIGLLSRFKKEALEENIDILILISGVEPNRTFLEKKLKKGFKNKNIVFVLGKIESQQKKWKENNITFYNFLLSIELQKLINRAKIVVCRSGYSSIMDLAILGKKAFFIPTKNQPEQEYLAKFLEAKKMAPFSEINKFSEEKLLEIKKYKGLKAKKTYLDFQLLSLFKGERKF